MGRLKNTYRYQGYLFALHVVELLASTPAAAGWVRTLARLMRFNAAFGPEHFHDIAYVRNVEYAIAVDKSTPGRGMRVLDVGSGASILPSYLLSTGAFVHASDMDDYVMGQGAICRGNKTIKEEDLARLTVDVEDIRGTDYPDCHFDRIIMLSMVEHIHFGDDSRAMREAARILKPGGRVVLTFDVARDAHELVYQFPGSLGFTMDDIRSIREEVRRDPSRRLQEDFTVLKKGHHPGYTRFYNERTMMECLVRPSGLDLVEHGYYGDGTFVIRAFFDRRRFVEYLYWLQPILSVLLCKKFDGPDRLSEKPGAIGYCVLEKPADAGRGRAQRAARFETGMAL